MTVEDYDCVGSIRAFESPQFHLLDAFDVVLGKLAHNLINSQSDRKISQQQAVVVGGQLHLEWLELRGREVFSMQIVDAIEGIGHLAKDHIGGAVGLAREGEHQPNLIDATNMLEESEQLGKQHLRWQIANVHFVVEQLLERWMGGEELHILRAKYTLPVLGDHFEARVVYVRIEVGFEGQELGCRETDAGEEIHRAGWRNKTK